MEIKLSYPFPYLKRKVKNADVIFVDFFDTLVYRYIHPSKVLIQWGNALKLKFPGLNESAESLLKVRLGATRKLEKIHEEAPYKEVLSIVYYEIEKDLSGCSLEDFIDICLEVDIAVEIGCQYPNKRLISLLNKAKKDGKKLYLISDFYLPQKAFEVFLRNIHCDKLFDEIFISEEYDKSKRHGSLYKYVLNKLNISPENVVMIGDNKKSDYDNSRREGINGLLYFSYFHKIDINAKKIFNYNYSKRYVKIKGRELYKRTLFVEYALMLGYTIRRIYNQASLHKSDSLSFISRGGYFLKVLFDNYQYICVPCNKGIKSNYLLNSRKVCIKAYEEYRKGKGTNVELFREYINSFIKDGSLYIVDEGWYHRSQTHIAEILGVQTYGYYVGSRNKPNIQNGKEHFIKGMLFDIDEHGNKSKYYDIFCTNCSMYEQILTARHGSVDGYVEKEGTIQAVFKENDKETVLYDGYINLMQEEMLLQFKGAMAWNAYRNEEMVLKDLAKLTLRSVLFANKKRCCFLNILDYSRYDNATEGKLKDKGIKQVHLNVIELLIHPERYVGMACKVQRKISRFAILRWMYYPLMYMYYLSVRFCERLF